MKQLFLFISFLLASLTRVTLADVNPILSLETGGHTAVCNWLDFTPNGKTLVSAGHDKVVRVWDVSDPTTPILRRSIRVPANVEQRGRLFTGSVSPNGKLCAVSGLTSELGNYHRIFEIDIHDGKIVRSFPGHPDSVTALAYSPTGDRLVSGGYEGTIRIWNCENVAAKPVVLDGHKGKINDIAWSPSSIRSGRPRIVSCSSDGTARIWSQSGGRWQAALVLGQHRAGVNAIACSNDGHWMATSADHKVRIWTADGTLVKTLTAPGFRFTQDPAIDFGSVNHLVTGGSFMRGGSGGGVWNVANGQLESRFKAHDSTVLSVKEVVQESTNTRLIASTGGHSNEIKLWDTQGKLLSTIVGRGSGIYTCAFSTDGRRIAWGQKADKLNRSFDLDSLEFRELGDETWFSPDSSGYSGGFRQGERHILLLQRNGRTVCRIARDTEDDYINCFLVLPKTQQIVVGSKNYLTLHALDGTVLRAFQGHQGSVWSVAASPDNQTVMSAGADQTIRFWKINGNEMPERRSVTGVHTIMDNSRLKVLGVISGLPAARAGLREGDIIRSVNSEPVSKKSQLIEATRRAAGSPVTLEIIRDNRTLNLELQTEFRDFAGISSPWLSLFFTDDQKDWIAWTDEGYYAASANGDALIGWQTNQGDDREAAFAAAWQYSRTFNRREVVQDLLATRLTASIDDRTEQFKLDLDIRTDSEILAPPRIEIASPLQYARIRGDSVQLTGTARPTGNLPITDVRVMVNKRPVTGTKALAVVAPNRLAGDAWPINIEVPLLPGQVNVIEVIASTKRATSAPYVVEVISEAPSLVKPELYVVGIGVAEYENADLRLRYSDDDVLGTIAALERQQAAGMYKQVHVTKLIDSDATEKNIRRALAKLKKDVTQHDVAVVIVSGHGETDEEGTYYFCPHDVDVEEDISVTGVLFAQMTEPLKQLPCKVVLCMDTCYSGGLINRNSGAKSIRNAVSRAIDDLTSIESGVVVMTSSTGHEKSLEHPDWEHGAFAASLIEALTGERIVELDNQGTKLPADLNADEIIEISEIDAYITARVKELTNGRQHPVTERGRVPSFPIAVQF